MSTLDLGAVLSAPILSGATLDLDVQVADLTTIVSSPLRDAALCVAALTAGAVLMRAHGLTPQR